MDRFPGKQTMEQRADEKESATDEDDYFEEDGIEMVRIGGGGKYFKEKGSEASLLPWSFPPSPDETQQLDMSWPSPSTFELPSDEVHPGPWRTAGNSIEQQDMSPDFLLPLHARWAMEEEPGREQLIWANSWEECGEAGQNEEEKAPWHDAPQSLTAPTEVAGAPTAHAHAHAHSRSHSHPQASLSLPPATPVPVCEKEGVRNSHVWWSVCVEAGQEWWLRYARRVLWMGIWIAVQMGIFWKGMVVASTSDDRLVTARFLFGRWSLGFARGAALAIHWNMALVFVTMCRGLWTALRGPRFLGRWQWAMASWLGSLLDSVSTGDALHAYLGWSILFWSGVHIIAHAFNLISLADRRGYTQRGERGAAIFLWLFGSGVGVTGMLLTLCLLCMAAFAFPCVRRVSFETFYLSHHLFFLAVLLTMLHGAFCFIPVDILSRPSPPHMNADAKGCTGPTSYRYILPGLVLYLLERIYREVWRASRPTVLSKVLLHPGAVLELQCKKPGFPPCRPGQYIRLLVPSLSRFQWHPFTLTSAPEENFLSVHIRLVGDWTMELARLFRISVDERGEGRVEGKGKDNKGEADRQLGDGSISQVIFSEEEKAMAGTRSSPLHGALPCVALPAPFPLPSLWIDGPFGAAAEDLFLFDVAICIGAGIGQTPFASILKSIWYRVLSATQTSPSPGAARHGLRHLKKCYFFGVCRETQAFEWFHDVLKALEEEQQSLGLDFLTFCLFLTGPLGQDQVQNMMIHDELGACDAITGLKSPTLFGRPDFAALFETIKEEHHPMSDSHGRRRGEGKEEADADAEEKEAGAEASGDISKDRVQRKLIRAHSTASRPSRASTRRTRAAPPHAPPLPVRWWEWLRTRSSSGRGGRRCRGEEKKQNARATSPASIYPAPAAHRVSAFTTPGLRCRIGVFYCGPKAMDRALTKACFALSDPYVEFVLRKEHF